MDETGQFVKWAIDRQGYAVAYIGKKKRNGKRRAVYQHRLVWEQARGPIPKGYEIHHIDENRSNNDLSNLECLSHREHRNRHAPKHRGRSTPSKKRYAATCSICGLPMVLKALRKKPPKCQRCHRRLADQNRKNLRVCAFCGATFQSRRGNFCSQRCVNLGARWKTDRL
jgi:hypothetical protein